MHNIESMLLEKNYSKCPLKKRPINYDFDEDVAIVIDNKAACLTGKQEPMLSDAAIIVEEPENLSLKKESCSAITASDDDEDGDDDEELIVVSDCCEDEGVDVGRLDDDSLCEDESIDCVDIENSHSSDANRTEAAALAAAVAAASAAASVVVPTPTYPKYTMPSWNFHMSPYTAEFYRTINNPHLCTQISPLRGELLSPSSPSDSVGSLSPPPHHYLPGRASSVSPPMRTEVIHRPIGVRQIPPSPQHSHHRFLPYPLAAYNPSHAHTPSRYPLGYINHHPPISPAYSETSYYSMRSLTPESIASPVPEDLSIKHPCNSIKPLQPLSENIKIEITTKGNTTAATAPATSASAVNNTTATTKATNKKDKAIPLRYQCLDCQKSYSTFSGLTKHQQFHCPAAEGNQIKKSFSCKDCDKTYVSLGALKMHIRTHTLPCKCNICGKAFSRPWLLQGHIRTHTGEKPFSCQHCHRAFADRSNLRAHLQTHSDIKKYSCTNCSKTFSRMSLLTKHSEGGCQGSPLSTVNTGISNSNPVSVELAAYPLYNHHLDH